MFIHLAIIFGAAIFDTVLVTGYVFYGTGVLLVTSVALAAGVPPLPIVGVIIAGVVLGDSANYTAGRFLQHHPRIKQALAATEQYAVLRRFSYQPNDTLVKRIVLATIFRFVAASRPVNAVMLGAMSRTTIRDLFTLYTAGVIWATVWMLVVLFVADVVIS